MWAYLGPKADPPPLPDLPWALVPSGAARGVQVPAGVQLAAGARGRRGHGAPRVSAHALRRGGREGSGVPRAGPDARRRRQRHASGLARHGHPGGRRHRGAAPSRRDRRLLAHHPVPDADLHERSGDRGARDARRPGCRSTTRTRSCGSRTGTRRRPFPTRTARGARDAFPRAACCPTTAAASAGAGSRANRQNDYLIDRSRQRESNFSGIEESPPLQDAAVQESMGPIVDRSRELLGSTDAGIIRVRQRLLEAALALRDEGREPPGVGGPGRLPPARVPDVDSARSGLARGFGSRTVLLSGPALAMDSRLSGASSPACSGPPKKCL